MIKLIVGEKGSGKTRVLIHDANEAIKKAKGHIVYMDIDNSRMFQIDYKIRFMGTKEYGILCEESFYGFICGVIASNYDIESIYIDNLTGICACKLDQLETLFKKISQLELKYNTSFIFTVNGTEDKLPDFLKGYMIQELQ